MTITAWLALTEVLWVVGLSTWIILERRSPTATLAWVFALAWFPVLGIPVYLLIGPRRLRRKRLRYRRGKSRLAETCSSFRNHTEAVPQAAIGLEEQTLAVLAERAGQPPPLQASRVDLLSCGDDCFAALEEAIQAAQHHVHLEYYIWEPDAVGTRFRDLLCQKAQSGVEVRLLVDAIGSSRLGRRFLRPLVEAGAQVAWFNPVSWGRFRPDLMNFRTHRKIVVCDGLVGFTGGMNLCDEHCAEACGRQAWRDTHVRLEGPPVAHLQRAFLEDWHFAAGSAASKRDHFPPARTAARGAWVQVLTSGPDDDSYAIERFCFAAIAGAQSRVLLTTPYFVPNESLLSALTSAALRGVEVRILVPKRSDSWLVTAAARSYFEDLVRVGVRIHEYGPPMLHSKTLLIDDGLALLGTANMDNRSFRLNFEIAVAFYDQEVAAALHSLFLADLKQAKAYSLRQARRAPFPQRFAEALARLLSPLL